MKVGKNIIVNWYWRPERWFIVFGTYDAWPQRIIERRFGPLHYVRYAPRIGGEDEQD